MSSALSGTETPQSAKAASDPAGRRRPGNPADRRRAWPSPGRRRRRGPGHPEIGHGILIARIEGGEPRHDLRPQIADIAEFRPDRACAMRRPRSAPAAPAPERPAHRSRQRRAARLQGLLPRYSFVNDPDSGRGGEFVERAGIEIIAPAEEIEATRLGRRFAASVARPEGERHAAPTRKFPGRRRTSLDQRSDLPHGGPARPPFKSHRSRRTTQAQFSARRLFWKREASPPNDSVRAPGQDTQQENRASHACQYRQRRSRH